MCPGRNVVDRGCRDASPVVSGRVPAIAHKLGPASGRVQAAERSVTHQHRRAFAPCPDGRLALGINSRARLLARVTAKAGLRTFANPMAKDKVAPRAVTLRAANNEEHGISRETLVSERCAISSRAPGLHLEGSMRRAVCPHSSIHVRVNRCQARSADLLSWDACSRYQIDAEAAQSRRGSGCGKGLATTDGRCN
jgi:hypothetical protein